MRWFNNLSTRAKLFLGFGSVILFLIIAIGTAYNGISDIVESEKKLYEIDFANATDLLRIRSNVNGIRAGVVDMLLAANRPNQDAWNQDIKNRTRLIDEALRRLSERNQGNPSMLARIGELTSIEDTYTQTRETHIIPLIYAGNIEEAKGLILGPQIEQYRKIRDIAEELGDKATGDAEAALAQSERRANESLLIFMISGVLALVVAAGMTALMNRNIANPLKDISGMAEQVASGDLTVNVLPDNRRDEVGVLTGIFGRMVQNLRQLNGEMREGISILASSASEILASTTQLASTAAETASAVSETTTTVEEVKQTVQVSSQKAKYVSETAQKTVQVSQSGKKAVEESIEGMNQIREQMETIAESIVRLSEQSQAIGEIMATVNDLAEQSNILAVNAAIEAARAGEQGKGFGVVAQEVKSLAEQSKQATAQVRTILGEIQKAVSGAVMATEQGGRVVEAGAKQSGEAMEAIRLLADSITEAAQSATQIAASSQQQLVGMDQVALAMESIKQASTQNVSATKQTEEAAQNLHELGQKLKQLVGQFKV